MISFGSRTIVLRIVLAFVVPAAAAYWSLSQVQHADGYYFNWEGQPYQRDYYGNYAYRDSEFQWWGCGSGWCWYGAFGSYVNISSPTAGYEYNSVGFCLSSGGCGGTWDGHGLNLYYSNTPDWDWATLEVDNYGTTGAIVGHCETGNCAGLSLMPTYGSVLEAEVPDGGPTGYCVVRQFSLYYGC